MTSLNSLSNIYATANAGWQVYRYSTSVPLQLQIEDKPYRPKEWNSQPAKSDDTQVVHIQPWMGYQVNNVVEDSEYGIAPTVVPNTIRYFFDAVIKNEHTTSLLITENPVQTGANISDHAYSMPSQLVMEIGMSDSMDSFIQGQYEEGSFGKSVNAYKTFIDLQKSRVPLIVNTRLNYYENMLIEQIHVDDDYKTANGLKATITFRQIFTATVNLIKVSTIPYITDSVNLGLMPITIVKNDSSLIKQIGVYIFGK